MTTETIIFSNETKTKIASIDTDNIEKIFEFIHDQYNDSSFQQASTEGWYVTFPFDVTEPGDKFRWTILISMLEDLAREYTDLEFAVIELKCTTKRNYGVCERRYTTVSKLTLYVNCDGPLAKMKQLYRTEDSAQTSLFMSGKGSHRVIAEVFNNFVNEITYLPGISSVTGYSYIHKSKKYIKSPFVIVSKLPKKIEQDAA